MDNREFDQLLKDRYVPEAPSNLTARIVEASKAVPQAGEKKPIFSGFGEAMQGFTDMFRIPQSAVIFASIAILSVGILSLGVYSTDILTVEPTPEFYSEAEEVELAFYLDDIFELDY